MKRIQIILTILTIILVVSCGSNEKKYHKLKDQKGYAYYDDDSLLWYIFIYNATTGNYESTTTSSPPSYESSTTTEFTPSEETVSNYSEMQETIGEEGSGYEESSSYESSSSSDTDMSESIGSDSSSDISVE